MALIGIAEGQSVNNSGPDRDEMANALALLTDADPGTAFELRAIATADGILPKATSALFTAATLPAAVEWAADHHWNGYTTYLGLNPVCRDLPLGPGRAVRADDVLRRRWLLLDIDPARPAGLDKESATDAEKAAAEQLAGQVLSHLTAAGWPAPVRVDSGNGHYLLYRIDLPNDEDNHILIKQVLTALDRRFSGSAGSVDAKVHDAPRIAKLPGGWARKGPGTAERPHRICQIIEMPATVQNVSREQLQQLADAPAGPAPSAPENNGQTSGLCGIATAGPKSIPERAIAYLAQCPPAISGQGGHDQTFAVARAVVWGFDLGPEVGFCLLWDHYNPRCAPPWSEKELRHKCEEADRVPFDKPRGWLLTDGQPQSGTKDGSEQPTTTPAVAVLKPYRPFPVNALPAPMATFVREGAAALRCDPTYFALPALTAAAAMIGNSRTITLKKGWTEPSVIWAAVIGDSGTLKSPALRTTMAPVFRLQRTLFRERKEKVREWKEKVQSWKTKKVTREAAVKKALKENKPLDDVLPEEPSPEEPTPVRVVTSDVTIEKLGLLLDLNPRGILVVRDELRGWLASFTRYKGQQAGSGDLPYWLEFFRAEPAIIDRKTGDRCTLSIPHAAVSVCGGVQPETFARALTPEHFETGLVARLIAAMPPKPPKKFSEEVISPETQDAWEKLLGKLRTLQLDKDDNEDLVPFALKLTRPAKETWVAFYNDWAERQAEADGDLASCLSKLEAYAARFALIHHVVSRVASGQDDSDPVELASIESGIVLAKWFADESERVYTVLAESKEQRAVRKLVDWIAARGGRVSPRDLQRSNSRRWPTHDLAEKALQELVDASLGRWTEGQIPEGGGYRPRWFELFRPTSDIRHSPAVEPDSRATEPDSRAADLVTNECRMSGVGRNPSEEKQTPEPTPPAAPPTEDDSRLPAWTSGRELGQVGSRGRRPGPTARTRCGAPPGSWSRWSNSCRPGSPGPSPPRKKSTATRCRACRTALTGSVDRSQLVWAAAGTAPGEPCRTESCR
jgi:hypothetical protein